MPHWKPRELWMWHISCKVKLTVDITYLSDRLIIQQFYMYVACDLILSKNRLFRMVALIYIRRHEYITAILILLGKTLYNYWNFLKKQETSFSVTNMWYKRFFILCYVQISKIKTKYPYIELYITNSHSLYLSSARSR